MAETLFAINARKKFKSLDTNGSGYLENEELLRLTEWVWSSFHPDGQPLSADEKASMSKKLLYRLDENSDGKLSMGEFEEYFLKTAVAIGNYRRRPSQLTATQGRGAHGKGAEDGGWEGKTVVIHGLKSRSELNGKKGMARKVSKETGRMGVHVGGEKLAIKIDNLRLDAPEEPPARERRNSIPDSLGTLVSGDPKSVAFTNARAIKKFRELDEDGSGFLEGDELLSLAEWVWSSFHPEGTPLSPAEKKAMVDKLLHRIDENSDGRLSAAEFEEYFIKTAVSIGRFRKRPSQVIYSKTRGLQNDISAPTPPMPPMTPNNSLADVVAQKRWLPPAKLNGAARPPPATTTLGNEPSPLPSAPKIVFGPMVMALARAEREAKEAADAALARKLALDKAGMLKPTSSGPPGDSSGEWVPCTDPAGGYVRSSSKALNQFSASLEKAVLRRRTSFAAVPEDDDECNAHVKGGAVEL